MHLIGRDEEAEAGDGPPSTGRLDHIAFRATDITETRARLVRQGYAYREASVPDAGLRQVFVRDPNGILIELNFEAEDTAAA